MARSLNQTIKDELAGLQLFPFFCLDFTDGENNYKYTTLDVPIKIYGSELITIATDRDFSEGQGNWDFIYGSEVTWDNISMNWVCTSTNVVKLDITMVVGVTYRIQFDITAYTSGQMECFLGGVNSIAIPDEAVGTFVVYGVAQSGNYLRFESDDFIGKIDNVSLKEMLDCTPRGFEFESINYTLSNVMDDCTLRIDNLDSVLTSIFVGGSVEEKTASVYLGLLDTDDKVLGSVLMFTGEVDSFELDESEVRMVIGSIFSRWGNQAYNKHSASCRWKVFKGDECSYSGGQTWCDRSYTRCVALANTANFGGFRFLPSIENKKIWWGPTSEQRQAASQPVIGMT